MDEQEAITPEWSAAAEATARCWLPEASNAIQADQQGGQQRLSIVCARQQCQQQQQQQPENIQIVDHQLSSNK